MLMTASHCIPRVGFGFAIADCWYFIRYPSLKLRSRPSLERMTEIPMTNRGDDASVLPARRKTAHCLRFALFASIVALINNLSLIKWYSISYPGVYFALSTNITSTSLALRRIKQNDDDFFSACLLTKDDGHFLIEWIAYHYHTLPLRHLIVAVDSTSKTSPSSIFDKWRALMTIEEWNDTVIFSPQQLRKMNDMENPNTPDMHRSRQRRFYSKCLKKLKHDNRTWTLMIDVDEYLSYNTYHGNMTESVETPGAFLSFLKEEMPKGDNETKLHSKAPCLPLPRLRYGVVESTPEQVSKHVPKGLNGTAFQTLRYRKHGKTHNAHGPGKAIVDVSRIEDNQFVCTSPHLPVKSCEKGKNGLWLALPNSSMVVRHYYGSEEQFFFRDDSRQKSGTNETGKSKESFDQGKLLDYGSDDAIRPWLGAFVDSVGNDVAQDLLDGVGNVSVAPLKETTGSRNTTVA